MRRRALCLLVVVLAGCSSVDPEPEAAGGTEVRIRGVVLDAASDQPVSAHVTLQVDARSLTQRTGEDGSFDFATPPGACALLVQAAGYLEGSFGLDCSHSRFLTIRLGTQAPDAAVDFGVADLPGYTPPTPMYVLSGTVRGEDGRPVEAAAVTLRSQDELVGEGRTGHTGVYAFQVPAARYEIEVEVACAETFRKTIDVAGNVSLDPILGGVRRSAPAMPGGLQAVPGPGPGQVTLTWSAPASQSPIHHYVIHRDGEPFQSIGNSLAWAMSQYEGTAAHDYSVSAIDICGNEGPTASAVEAQPLAGGALPVPVSTSAASGVEATQRHYPAMDAQGETVGTRAWRTVTGVGNCCETYVSATADGRIYEYGGTNILYSDDRGLTWQQVGTPVPQTGAEGTIVPAPGGDVLAFNWSLYTGDQLWVHKYVAATGQWYYQQVPLHQPFYDRPWIAVAEGPFHVGDLVAPYVAFAMSNYVHGATMLASLDGLHYAVPTDAALPLGQPSIDWAVPVDPERDWVQTIREARVVPIDNGAVLRGRATLSSCTWAALQGDLMWGCAQGWHASAEAGDAILVDSNGHIHWIQAAAGDSHIQYQVSQDGGRKWQKVSASLPDGLVIEDWDAKANGAVGVAVVAVHASRSTQEAAEDQDLVFRFRGTQATPFLAEVLKVGLGDHTFGSGLASSYDRFDFTTIAILPDGKVAVSFGDSQHPSPAVAIEL